MYIPCKEVFIGAILAIFLILKQAVEYTTHQSIVPYRFAQMIRKSIRSITCVKRIKVARVNSP